MWTVYSNNTVSVKWLKLVVLIIVKLFLNNMEENINNIDNKPKKPQGFAVCPENINKKGRPPKEWTWSHIIEDEVERLGKEKLGQRGEKLKRTMVKKMIGKVVKDGDVQAMKELMNRTDGLPRQYIEANVNLYRLKIVRSGEDATDKDGGGAL